MLPVSGTITGSGRAFLLCKSLYQERLFPEAAQPVLLYPAQHFTQCMGGEIGNPYIRIKKTIIADYPVQTGKAVLRIPTDKLVARRDVKGAWPESEGTQTAMHCTVY